MFVALMANPSIALAHYGAPLDIAVNTIAEAITFVFLQSSDIPIENHTTFLGRSKHVECCVCIWLKNRELIEKPFLCCNNVLHIITAKERFFVYSTSGIFCKYLSRFCLVFLHKASGYFTPLLIATEISVI